MLKYITLRFTQEEFESKSMSMHGEYYNYSQSNYINVRTNVDIICPVHGLFSQNPKSHMNGSGCTKCSGIMRRSKLQLTNEEFEKRAREVHGDRYNYSKMNYVNGQTKIIIICKIHGEFMQCAGSHINNKNGCPKCTAPNVINFRNKKYTIEEFTEKSNKIHDYRYDYSKSDYKNCKEKIIIICSKDGHGEFLLEPDKHLNRKYGCPKCHMSKGEAAVELYLKSNNINYVTQKRFEDCKNINKLPFDFYLEDYNLLIEYDGQQHFELRFSFLETEFDRIKINDNIKNMYCKDNKINLLRIPYTDLNSINKILDNYICLIKD